MFTRSTRGTLQVAGKGRATLTLNSAESEDPEADNRREARESEPTGQRVGNVALGAARAATNLGSRSRHLCASLTLCPSRGVRASPGWPRDRVT